MSFRQPDPQAPLGSDLRPIHQSDYAPIMGGPDYTPPGGGVWAKTVGGTAFHNRMADVCNGAQRRPALYYVDEALKRERKVAWGRYTPESLAMWVEECCVATDNVFRPRREDGWVAEICFRYQDPETRYWYEGTIDLLNLQREAERIKSASIIDYKTGETLPDLRLGPQHHEYSLAVKYGVLDHVPYFEDTRLLDWSKMTALPLIPRKWPKEFRFLHVPALLKRGSWFALGMGSDGEPMTETDSLATMRALTKRLLENQPTRLAVAIPAEPSQPENEMGNPQTTAIIPAQITQPLHAPKYELTAAEVVAQGQKIQEVMRAAMKVDEDYGIIPGTSRKDRDGNEKSKPTLLKPGAEKLLLLFRLAPTFEITKTADGEHREIFVRCKLTHIVSGDFVGEGVGECSTRESKYAWRQADRKCPKCEQPAIFKSKKDGGWFCWDKKGGCGAQFRAGEQSIEGQEIGRKPNTDLADTYNTVTKMACKRALVMAVLNTTGASFLFTQDLEDFASDAPTHYESEVIAPAPEQPAAPQYSWGEPRGEGFATDAQIKRLKANCAAMGVGEAKCLARIIQLAGEFGTSGISSVAEIPFPVATKIVIKVEEALKAKGIPRPEREKTEAERIEEQVRQIVGELRTKRAKELADLVRSGPLSATEIIDIMANEAAPNMQFSALAEPQQEQVLHTIKQAAQAAADRVALAANGNGHK